MAVSGGAVRCGRSSLRVAVTAAGGAAGTAVAAALGRARGAGDVAEVIVLDEAVDRLAAALAGVDVVVHPACQTDLSSVLHERTAERRNRTVEAMRAVLAAAARARVRRVVVVTSAMVYGAHPDNPIPLPEDAPLRAPVDDGLVGDLLAVEDMLASSAGDGVRTTVLRPAALVGPGVDTVTTRHFEAPRLLTIADAVTLWQFCHLDDLAEAVGLAVVADLDGALTVGCEGVLTQQLVERLSGMRHLELPLALARGTAERLHRVGVLPMPPGDLAYTVFPWVVPSSRLLSAGWRPRYDNETCLGVLLEQVGGHHAVGARRVDRADAALGAAGAAVALVGTAAAWRQARHRRRGQR